MSEPSAASTTSETMPKPAKPVPPVTIADFATIAANMNRFLAWLASLAPFKEEGAGIAEWLIMMMIAEIKEANSYKIAWVLGFPGQRILRIAEALIKSELLAIAGPTDTLAADSILALTNIGKSRLDSLNAELWPLIAVACAGGENKLATVIKYVPILGRIGTP